MRWAVALAFVLAVSTATAWGANWEPFAETSAGVHSLDRASLQTEGDEARAWVRTEYSPAAARERAVVDQRLKGLSYSLVRHGLNCRKRTVTIEFEGNYDRRGNLLGDIEAMSDPSEVPPGSLADLLSEQVCASPSMKEAGFSDKGKRGKPGQSTKPYGSGQQ